MTPRHESRVLVEQLARLGHEHRHLQQEHEREAIESPTRHALAVKMRRVIGRFERLLSHWIDDDDLRDEWQRFVHEGGPQPDAPLMTPPPAWKGVTETGSIVEVRAAEDGGYDLIVDGNIETHERVPWALEPAMSPAAEPVRVGQHLCHEVFEAPPAAVRALADFLARPDAEPPRTWARVLFEDGLIDAHFGLTPRGDRRLRAAAAPRPVEGPSPITFGVLVADAARARVLILRHSPGGLGMATIDELVEVADTTRPDERARDSEIFADTRPGLRQLPNGPSHGVSDHRESHRREGDKRFATEIVEQATRIWRDQGVTRAVLIASPVMLGALRPAFSKKRSGPLPWTLREFARDLTRLSAPALHDLLASTGFLPPRGRLPPLRESPGQPQ